MNQNGRNRSVALLIVIGAIVAGLLVIGATTEWFGLRGTEVAPGATTPPDNPS